MELSIAYDFNINENKGILVGLKYFNSSKVNSYNYDWEYYSRDMLDYHIVSVFVNYRFLK
jgi:hypothetical protein